MILAAILPGLRARAPRRPSPPAPRVTLPEYLRRHAAAQDAGHFSPKPLRPA